MSAVFLRHRQLHEFVQSTALEDPFANKNPLSAMGEYDARLLTIQCLTEKPNRGSRGRTGTFSARSLPEDNFERRLREHAFAAFPPPSDAALRSWGKEGCN